MTSPKDRRQPSAEPSRTHADVPSRLPRLLTVAQVAESLQLSERHVRRLIADSTLPVYRLSEGIVRIDEQDLLGYLNRLRR